MRVISVFLAVTLYGVSLMTAWADGDLPADTIATNFAEPAPPQNIRVLLKKDATEALLEVKGPYYLFNPKDGTKLSTGLLGKRFLVHSISNGLQWGEKFPGLYQFMIVPKSEETSIFVDGVQYGGHVAIYSTGTHINIVNDLDIESYVRDQLSSAQLPGTEGEVLSALAILARTNAYYTVMRHQDVFWNVSAADAGYQGCGLIAPHSPVIKAVDSTRHLILVQTKAGRPLPFATAWTEHSAGKTASYETMFRKETVSSASGISAPHAALDRSETKWSYAIGKKSLAQQFGLAQVDSVELFTDPVSNKVYGIRLKEGQEVQNVDFFTLQSRLGRQYLLSSDFTVMLKDDSVFFNGFGKGHGVGLCLYSAAAMAQNGDNAVKILSKFYPDAYLQNLNAIPQGR
jgi:stage II sporulation protein D